MVKNFICVKLSDEEASEENAFFPSEFFSKNNLVKIRINNPGDLKPGDKVVYLGNRNKKSKALVAHGKRADRALTKRKRYEVVHTNSQEALVRPIK